MQEKIDAPLGSVQKTLFLPLWGRAVEMEKEKPLLVDKTAREVINRVNYDFSQIANNIHPLTRLAWIMRGIYTDSVIQDYIKEFPGGTIVNLGCGLDTSFERNDNGILNWYELDLPDVIALRKKFFKENERRHLIAASVLDDEWVEKIEVKKNLLFIVAGLLYYLTEADVKKLFKRIADNFSSASIICDISSPLGVSLSNKLVIKNTGLDESSYLKWGIENDKDIERWDSRYKIVRRFFYYRYRKLKIGLKMRFYGYMADRKRIQYMIFLRLGK